MCYDAKCQNVMCRRLFVLLLIGQRKSSRTSENIVDKDSTPPVLSIRQTQTKNKL